MRLTVAVCTWNRASLLDQTLSSMSRLRIPDAVEWELLIVNNNCTDHTDQIIAKYNARLPIRRLFERQLGKAFALNCAIREVRGEYVLWTDDDVIVHPDWIASYSRGFVRWPNASVFGGPIRPWFSGGCPEWLDRILPYAGGAYGIRDLGIEPIILTSETAPYGGNVAIRAEEQARYSYDTGLGPQGKHYSTGEDTDLIYRMLADGAEGRWVPDAVVWHYIPENRQTLKYIQAYYKGYGNYLGRRMRRSEQPTFLGKPLWVWRKTIGVGIKYLKYRIRQLFSEPEVWIKDFTAFSLNRGMLEGIANRRRSRQVVGASR